MLVDFIKNYKHKKNNNKNENMEEYEKYMVVWNRH